MSARPEAFSTRPVRVLVVDDSFFMRRIITDLLQRDERIEVVGTARDGIHAVEEVKKLSPDVVTLDVEMPRCDGIETLRRLMETAPTRVVMLSSLTSDGVDVTMTALDMGAVDFVTKPSGTISLDLHRVADELVFKVVSASRARLPIPRRSARPVGTPARPGGGRGAVSTAAATATRVVVIGASTGGPRALQQVIAGIPGDIPCGILVVQHMPAGFTKSLAKRLGEISPLAVSEASGGETLHSGQVLVAPGDYHMEVMARGGIRVTQDPALHGVRPAVDVTMESAAAIYGRGCVGVILTGMGFDGMRGMARIKEAGGTTIAEHQSTCIVYGMPRAVIESGIAQRVVPLHGVAREVDRAVRELAG